MIHALCAVAAAVLAASPTSVRKQGDSPLILVNPDTVITSTSFDISQLEGAADRVIALSGGHYGVAVKDFSTGESFTRSEGGVFDIGSPELIVAACAIDLDRMGECSLDTLSSRDETVGDQISMGREGDMEATNRITGRVRPERIRSWLDEEGFDDTEFHGVQLLWPGAPDMEPNTSTPGDLLGMLGVIQSRLGEAEIRRITRNPFTRTALEDIQSGGTPIYGFSSRGEGGRCRAAVFVLSGNHMVGVVVVGDQLSGEDKADLAFRMMWEAMR
jgi:hypothetical protein